MDCGCGLTLHLTVARNLQEHCCQVVRTLISSAYIRNCIHTSAGILDAYLLKSLDGIAQYPNAETMYIVKCRNGTKICMFQRDHFETNPSTGKPEFTISLGRYSPHDPAALKLVAIMKEAGVLSSTNEQKTAHTISKIGIGLSGVDGLEGLEGDAGNAARLLAEGSVHTDALFVQVFESALDNATLIDYMAKLGRSSGTPYPLVYDAVINCLGWKHDQALYGHQAAHGGSGSDSSGGSDAHAAASLPWMQQNGKYPIMSSEYESRNIPGMYFAGQLGHGKDFRRAAGGFIHGFRYTTRALHRILEARYHSTPWHGASFAAVQDWNGKDVGLQEFG